MFVRLMVITVTQMLTKKLLTLWQMYFVAKIATEAVKRTEKYGCTHFIIQVFSLLAIRHEITGNCPLNNNGYSVFTSHRF